MIELWREMPYWGRMNDDQLSVRAAWLYHMEGLTQADIAARLKTTRIKVNRLLAEARDSGLVRVTLNSQLASCVALERELCAQTGLRDAVIVPTPDEPERLPVVLGQAAADYLGTFLRDTQITGLGIGWGATLRATIHHVATARYPGLTVGAMMGGLTRGLDINTFEIASDLAARLGAGCSYLAAPIYAGSPRSRDVILAQDVFEEAFARIRAMQVAILSVGDLTRKSLLIRNGLPRDVSVQDLRMAGAVGDIMGQFLDAEGRAVDHEINRRVIALPLAELRQIPTVIVASGGANKTRILAAILRAKLASVLVCDERTAAAALRIATTPD